MISHYLLLHFLDTCTGVVRSPTWRNNSWQRVHRFQTEQNIILPQNVIGFRNNSVSLLRRVYCGHSLGTDLSQQKSTKLAIFHASIFLYRKLITVHKLLVFRLKSSVSSNISVKNPPAPTQSVGLLALQLKATWLKTQTRHMEFPPAHL